MELKKDDIFLVIGSEGLWQNENFKKYAQEISSKIVVNTENLTTNSSHSLKLAIDNFQIKNDLVVLYGDIVFDLDQLEMITRIRNRSTLLCRKAFSISESGIALSFQDGSLTSCLTSESSGNFPWFIFSGMVYMDKTLVREYNENQIFNKNLISTLLALNSKDKISICDMFEPLSGNDGVSHTPIDLNGGSYARLRKKLVVLKEAKGEGFEKLTREFTWLLELPQEIKRFFPEVVSHGVESNSSWYEMPWYDLPNIRKNILVGKYNSNDVLRIVKNVLVFMADNLYSVKKGLPAEDFVKIKHFDRVYYRLFEVWNFSDEFKNIIKSKNIILNGTHYENLPKLFSALVKKRELINFLTPKELVMIHGDLHFQNILVDSQDSFILADPRGELEGSDIYYDLGKLWHSINGLYDLIHTNQFEIKIEIENDITKVQIDFLDKERLKVYSEIKKHLIDYFATLELFKDDHSYMIKILFNEAMHFCSVMTFHLNRYGDEKRSMAMYFIGVKLLNEFMNLSYVNDQKEFESCYSFNSEQELIELLNTNKIV